MCKHQNRSGHGILGVGREFGHVVFALPHPHVLCLLHQHELAIGHHRKATRRGKHFVHICVTAVKHRFIEILETLVHHRVQQRLHDFRDEKRLLAVQDIKEESFPPEMLRKIWRCGMAAKVLTRELDSRHGHAHAFIDPSAPLRTQQPTRANRKCCVWPEGSGSFSSQKSGCVNMSFTI